MSIHSLPSIKINGSNKLYGGYFYKISYQQGFFSEPSRMTLSVINEEGKYGVPPLGYSQKYNINIGGQNFLMFAVSSRSVESTAGNTLEIDFVDNNQILDKYFVGLSGKQGFLEDKSTPECLILVGVEIDPCRQEKPPFTPELINDPYAISIVNDGVERIIDCETFRANNILEVDYAFSDLIKGMSQKGISIRGFNDKNPNYRNKYIGNLREVLNSWCTDYGFSYFFDGSGSLNFIDVSAGISIDFDAPSDESLLSKTTERTVEGTVSRGAITYFGVEGQERCNFGSLTEKGKIIDYKRLLNCAPVTLNSVFPYGINKVSKLDLPISVVLSKYSPSLRSCYFLYSKYSLHTALEFNTPQFYAPEFGDFYVVNSYRANAQGSFLTIFNALYNSLPSAARPDRSRVKFAYAYWNPGFAEQQYSFEQTIADDFLGRYWYADYGQTAINARPGPPDIQTADGANANYFKTPDVYVPIGSEKHLLSLNLSRFILVDRNASWFPNSSDSSLESYWQTFVPGATTTIPSDQAATIAANRNLAGTAPIAFSSDQLQMFVIITPPSSMSVSQSSTTHPIEDNPVSSAENGGQGINYIFGLMDKTTATVDINSSYSSNLVTPVGSLFGFNGQYKILIDEGLGIANKCFTTNKVESIVTKVNCSKDHERLDISLLDDTYLNIKDLYECNENGCIFNEKVLKEYELNYSTPTLFTKISYTIGGLISMPSPDQGLLEFNINIDAEGGVTTDLVVGNSAATPPSTDYSVAKSMFATNNGRWQYGKSLNYS